MRMRLVFHIGLQLIVLVSLCRLAVSSEEASPDGEMLEEPRLAHSDVLGLSDFSYDVMAKLAGSGLLSGYSARHFRFGFAYTRKQIADIIAKAIHSAQEGSLDDTGRKTLAHLHGDEDKLLLWQTARQFCDELRADEPLPTTFENMPTSVFTSYALSIRPIASLSLDSKGVMLRHQGFFSVLARLNKKTSVQIRLNTSRQTSLFESYNKPLLDVATISTELFGGKLDLGRGYERFGPASVSGGILTDGAHPIDMFRWSGRVMLPIVGKVRVRQLVGYLQGDENGKRFILARRSEKSFGDSFVFGFNEVQLSKPFPSPISFLLPLYPASRLLVRMGRNEDSDEIIVSADMSWIGKGGTRFYIEWVIDDVRLAKPAERQMGCIVGFQMPFDVARKRLGLTVEYARFDKNTFTHRNRKLNYQYRNESLGYVTGPNSMLIFGRLDFPISQRMHIALLGARAQHGRKTSPDWEQYFSAQFFYDINPSLSIGLHYTKGMPPRCGKPIHAGAWDEAKERADYVSFEINMLL